MYKPRYTPVSQNTSSRFLPNTFSLLTWNMQKTNFLHYAHQPIEKLLNIPSVHLLSLQEVIIKDKQNKFFNLPFLMAPNIETSNDICGVLTASLYQQQAKFQNVSRNRELGFATHKTAIITEHKLANNRILTNVNIHAINFVPNHIFKQELLLLWNKIEHINGALIISGDFNTWNKKRLYSLLILTRKLRLKKVNYPDLAHIKKLNNQPLDHIFYRGLELENAAVLSVPHISDHNPLLAKFKLKE